MRICFNDSLCKKCPHNGDEWCDYKKEFYEQAPPMDGKYIVIHRCQKYPKLFQPGQVVCVNLFHQVRVGPKEWTHVLAFNNVPGRILGISGAKYKVELFEAAVLMQRKGRPKREKQKLFTKVSLHARHIRPVHMSPGEPCDVNSITFVNREEHLVVN